MKSSMRIFLISFLAAISLIICNCGGGDHRHDNHDDDTHGIIAEANQKLVTMRVPQVPCLDCKAKIEAVFKAQDGIVRYQVFKAAERTRNVIIVYDPKKIQIAQIEALITKMGKTVENVTEN